MTVVVLPRDTDGYDYSGSARNVKIPATLTYDFGRGWCGIVARDGRDIADAATVGLTPGEKIPRGDVPDLDEHDVWLPYIERVLDVGEAMWDDAFGDRDVRVVVEATYRPNPIPKKGRGGKNHRVPAVDWMPGLMFGAAAAARYSQLYMVAPMAFGERHQKGNGGTGVPQAYYDPALIGKSKFELMEHPDGTRNHEQACSDASVIADLQIREASPAEVRRALAVVDLAVAS